MKTTLDSIDILYAILFASALKDEITGKIYKLNRQLGSNKEDVVINSLPITGNQLQRSTLNVNIYVPDMSIKIDGQTQRQPNYVRLKTLAALAVLALADHYNDTYNLWISNQAVLSEDATKQHYVNFRIEFKNVNTL